MSQASGYLVKWLRANVDCDKALDYGCGKLRYSVHLVRYTRRLTCVDSEVQLSRLQRVGEQITSVRTYVARYWRTGRVLSVEQFAEDTQRYDFILCSNVLSAIPSKQALSAVLRRLGVKLKPDGQVLFVAQYRNWYFKSVLGSGRAQRHLNGWVLNGPRGSAYYGILDKDRLMGLVKRHGLAVASAWTHGEAAYVLAGQRRRRGRSPQKLNEEQRT